MIKKWNDSNEQINNNIVNSLRKIFLALCSKKTTGTEEVFKVLLTMVKGTNEKSLENVEEVLRRVMECDEKTKKDSIFSKFGT